MQKLKNFEDYLSEGFFTKNKPVDKNQQMADNIQQHLDAALNSGVDYKFYSADDEVIIFKNGDSFGYFDNESGVRSIHYTVKNTMLFLSCSSYDSQEVSENLRNKFRELFDDESTKRLDDNEIKENWSELKNYLYTSHLNDSKIMNFDKFFSMNENNNLTIEQLADISSKALDDAYHYGISEHGNNFGWLANIESVKAAKELIDAGETDIEEISSAIHDGWNITANADYNGELNLDTPTPDDKKEKRKKLAEKTYDQLPEEEKEKDRVVARAVLNALA